MQTSLAERFVRPASRIVYSDSPQLECDISPELDSPRSIRDA